MTYLFVNKRDLCALLCLGKGKNNPSCLIFYFCHLYDFYRSPIESLLRFSPPSIYQVRCKPFWQEEKQKYAYLYLEHVSVYTE